MKICAVITTYNKPEILQKVLESLKSQTYSLNQIVVVDNSEDDLTERLIRSQYRNVTYHHYKENIGSAGGFHEGLKLACYSNDFAFTLDDDVIVGRLTIEEVVPYISKLESRENRLGVIRPNMKNNKNDIVEIESFAWRGTLIKTEVIKEVGLPEKRFFLYCDDVEYAERIRRAGYKMYNVVAGRLKEVQPSLRQKISFSGIAFEYYMDSFRLYYAFRNQMVFYIENKYFPKVVKLIFYALKGVFLFLLLGQFKKIIAIINGLYDGVLGRLGKCEKYMPASI